MPPFTPGLTRVTEEPFITVDPGLPVGEHRFQLVVKNRRGVQSAPDECTVEILPREPLPGPIVPPVPGPVVPIPPGTTPGPSPRPRVRRGRRTPRPPTDAGPREEGPP